jgi:hypothetical protein
LIQSLCGGPSQIFSWWCTPWQKKRVASEPGWSSTIADEKLKKLRAFTNSPHI